MLDEKDLQAIAAMLDAKLAPINVRLDRLEAGQAGMTVRMDKLEAGQAGMTARLDKLEAGQAGMAVRMDKLEAGQAGMTARLDKLEAGQERMKNELNTELSHEFNALLEVHVDNQLKTLADGHALIIAQMAKKEELDDAKEVIHSLLDVLKIVVRQHSDEIKELKKAQ